MIEQPLQMRFLPSWLGQGTEQHDKYKEKKNQQSLCTKSKQPTTKHTEKQFCNNKSQYS